MNDLNDEHCGHIIAGWLEQKEQSLSNKIRKTFNQYNQCFTCWRTKNSLTATNKEIIQRE